MTSLHEIVGRDGSSDTDEVWRHHELRVAGFYEDDKGLTVMEECDGYFGLTLNRVGVERLIDWLTAARDRMPT